MWQALRTELHPQGLEIVTVALDTAGADAARPHIERAAPDHPSLIDESHVLDELLGVVNVPQAVWVDESGTIVRGPEVASPGRGGYEAPRETPENLPPEIQEMLELVRGIKVPRHYVDAVRDWVANGAESHFALSPDEVVRRSRPRPPEVARAAASFELGQHLWRAGHSEDAVRWFRDAHRLQPDNWTYKRQAWTFADARQGPNEQYDGYWAKDVKAIGAANYYEPVPDID